MSRKTRQKATRQIEGDQFASEISTERQPDRQAGAVAPADGTPPRWLRRQHMVAAILFVSAIAVFWPVRYHPFSSIDDPLYVSANTMVTRGLTAGGVRWAMTTFQAANWHPLTWVSHMLDVKFFGLAPGGHHLMSVLIHALSAALLFLALWSMTGTVGRSAAVAALFSLHPLRVESVAWIAERKDVLSGLFWMLTLIAYLRWVRFPHRRRYLAALAAFALGLLSKPMIITLPFVLLLLDFWPLGRLQFPGRRCDGTLSFSGRTFSKILFEKVPFLILAIASGLITLIAQQSGGAVGSVANYPLPLRVANALVAYVRYIHMTLLPRGLTMMYPYPELGLSAAAWLSSGALLAALTYLCVRVAARRPNLAVGWFWFLGTLVPVIGLVQVGMQSIADRYTYIPHIGLFVAGVWSVPAVPANWPGKGKNALGACVVLALVALVATTRTQLGFWKTNKGLSQHAVTLYPNNWVMRTELGLILAEEGDVQGGIEQYKASLRANPKYVYTHFNLGVALNTLGRVDEAVEAYRTALRLSPSFAEAHHDLGMIMLEMGRLAEAAVHFAEAVQIKPDYGEAYHGLAMVSLQQGNVSEAAKYVEKTIQLQPWKAGLRDDLARARSHFLEIRRRGISNP